MSNPVDDYLETCSPRQQAAHAFTKSAMAKRAFGSSPFARALGGSLVAGGALMGAEALYEAAKKTYHAAQKKKHFQAMLEQNPDLRVEQRNDRTGRFENHYNSLHRMSPTFSADPIVAGTYMRQMQLNPNTAGSVVVDAYRAAPPGRPATAGGPTAALQQGQKLMSMRPSGDADPEMQGLKQQKMQMEIRKMREAQQGQRQQEPISGSTLARVTGSGVTPRGERRVVSQR